MATPRGTDKAGPPPSKKAKLGFFSFSGEDGAADGTETDDGPALAQATDAPAIPAFLQPSPRNKAKEQTVETHDGLKGNRDGGPASGSGLDGMDIDGTEEKKTGDASSRPAATTAPSYSKDQLWTHGQKLDTKLVSKVWTTQLQPSLGAPDVAEPLASSGFLEAVWAIFPSKNASSEISLVVATMICEKIRIGVEPWDVLTGGESDQDKISELVRSLTSVLLDEKLYTDSPATLLPAVHFLNSAFERLDVAGLKEEVMKLVSIGMWEHVVPRFRQSRNGKAWQREVRRFEKLGGLLVVVRLFFCLYG